MRLAFLRHWTSRFRGELALIGGLSLASSAVTLALPWLAAQLAASMVGEAAVNLDETLILLAVALTGLAGTTIMVAILSERASGRILANLRKETHERIVAMPMAFHDRSRGGDLLSLMSHEVENLSTFLTATLARVPSMAMTAAGAFIILFIIDPVLTFTIPILIPPFFIVMKWVGRRLRVLGRQVRRAEVDIVWIAESDIEMLPAIKAFAVEREHRSRYAAAVEKARLLKLKQARITAFIGPIVALVAAIAAIVILVIGSAQVQDGARSPSEMFAFLFYAALLTRPVGSLADTYGRFQIAKGTLARLEAVFAMRPEPGYDRKRRIERARGAIAIDAVSFAYPGRPAVLTNASLAIAPGETIALTGDNGIGKSTLVNLILRFYQPDQGRITLDGVDIADLQVQDLRRQFGYVPQRPLLAYGSIAENIAFGCPDPDPAAIEKAARLAQAWEFIERLPRGLATEIGDGGVRLSGGQRQRLALARALFRDPPIYIFDEATSMFDLDGETAFIQSCADLLTDRTVIIITHRPASLALADRIIEVTPQGFKVIEQAEEKARR
ncbi:ATP-binding cassette subfamily B protein [Porphyrobacter sp. MBR-155]|jgi:ATP-binding cassette subfamily B protein/subfamily B ATP-binding cassette protein MsbA|uniref:ABC transporter ATP-binding protein n=1 Tax=Porphyrobacter sp. MBR-155 TaxID=3156464 RepID=UPI00339A2DDF